VLHLDASSSDLARPTEREVERSKVRNNFTRRFAMQTENAVEIAKINDAFRRSGFGITVTPGVQVLEDLPGLIDEVRRFNEFSEENDPYGEHDFGTVHWYGEKVFWKIDYYDQKLEYGEEPLSPDCRRVMTVMLASEY
jgi:hypothetical protein